MVKADDQEKPVKKPAEQTVRKTVPINPFLMTQVSEEEEANLMISRTQRLVDTLIICPGEAADVRTAHQESIITSLKRFAPRDEAEEMLASQIILAHDAAMNAFRIAAIPDQTFEGRDMHLNHAEKLAALYVKQLEALDKHRGKGQQKITVEHVNVEAGGQAIVGNVTAGTKTSARDVTHKPGDTVPVIDRDSAVGPVPAVQPSERKKD